MRLRMRLNRYLNKKRSSDKVGDMDKIACQQKRSIDKVEDNDGNKNL